MCLFGYVPITYVFAWICTAFAHLIIGCAIRYPKNGNLRYGYLESLNVGGDDYKFDSLYCIDNVKVFQGVES